MHLVLKLMHLLLAKKPQTCFLLTDLNKIRLFIATVCVWTEISFQMKPGAAGFTHKCPPVMYDFHNNFLTWRLTVMNDPKPYIFPKQVVFKCLNQPASKTKKKRQKRYYSKQQLKSSNWCRAQHSQLDFWLTNLQLTTQPVCRLVELHMDLHHFS